jgi:caffeoylshikimate esterase
MGGAVALWILLHFGQEQWTGLWLMCPMCKIADDLTPPQPVVTVLTALASYVPTWPVVPSSSIIDKAYKDPVYVKLVKSGPFYVDYEPRIQTAVQLLGATKFIDQNMEKITLPYVITQGDKDCVTDPRTVQEFHRRSQSQDKTLHMYPGVWHGIYEDPDGGQQAWKDTLKWLKERS